VARASTPTDRAIGKLLQHVDFSIIGRHLHPNRRSSRISSKRKSGFSAATLIVLGICGSRRGVVGSRRPPANVNVAAQKKGGTEVPPIQGDLNAQPIKI
jgi:hypothetical protein